ncbi:MAG: hypothetical protein E6Q32_06465 [Neisseriales bacterium]|nr:MAG: hypothetical protein E6Q32_06465 [Neisseriales bacterium]
MYKLNLTITKKLTIVLAGMFSIAWAADNMNGMNMSGMDMSNMKGMSSGTHSKTKHQQMKHSASGTNSQK